MCHAVILLPVQKAAGYAPDATKSFRLQPVSQGVFGLNMQGWAVF